MRIFADGVFNDPMTRSPDGKMPSWRRVPRNPIPPTPPGPEGRNGNGSLGVQRGARRLFGFWLLALGFGLVSSGALQIPFTPDRQPSQELRAKSQEQKTAFRDFLR